MHGAFQDLAISIHLAQLALCIDFIPAMYQQVFYNQATVRADAESIFYDCGMRHKLPLIQAVKRLIPYAFDQLNANLCSDRIFSLPAWSPCLGAARAARMTCAGNADAENADAENKTAGIQPAAPHPLYGA